MRRFVLCVAWATLTIAGGELLVTTKDLKIAADAKVSAVALCKDLDELVVSDSAKEDLKAASGDNWALGQMKGANGTDAVITNMQDNMDTNFILKTSGSIVAAFVFSIAWWMCCWTACPCCKCCRVRKREHKPHRIFKMVAAVVVLAVIFGIAVAAIVSQRGFNRAVAGFKDTSCSGSKLLNTTLSGHDNPHFLGMLPSLSLLDDLTASLDDNSQFMMDLKQQITNTKPIEEAVTLASGTLTLLRDMMAEDANKKPKTSLGVSLLHECALCPKLQDALSPAIDSLDNGIAVKLKDARGEVEKQLTGQKLTDLRATVKEATKPLGEMKNMFVTSFGWMVDSTTLQDATSQIDSFGLYSCLLMVIACGLIALCATSSLGFWTFKEHRTTAAPGQSRVTVPPGSTKLQYSARVHRCAVCSWCCGCVYLFYAFLIGGIMTIASVPLASVCLILDDISGPMLDDISGALSVNLTGDPGDMMKGMIDQCFNNPNQNANPYLLDIIYTRNASSNLKTTLRKTIVNDTRDMIENQFKEISNSMKVGSLSLANDPNIVKLTNTLQNTMMSGMMLVPASFDWSTSEYAAMATDPRSPPSDGLAGYWASSAACGDFTVPADMGAASGNSIKGVSSFSKYLAKDFGTNPNPTITAPACAQQTVCTLGTGLPACTAANKLVQLKQDLRAARTFKCRQFMDDNGASCDINNMVLLPSGKYSNDCMRSDGTVAPFEYLCTLDEFTALVQGYSTRLDKVFARLDKSANTTLTGINVGMKNLVDTAVISKITTFADGVTCGFLGKSYKAFVKSTCYAGVAGFIDIANSYVACGVLTLIMVILMYFVWRISVDNYNSNFEGQSGEPASDQAYGTAYVVRPANTEQEE